VAQNLFLHQSLMKLKQAAPNPFVLHASRFAIDCTKNRSQRPPARLRRNGQPNVFSTVQRLFYSFNSLAIRPPRRRIQYGVELREAPLIERKTKLLARAADGIWYSEHLEGDGATIFEHVSRSDLQQIRTLQF
jgi:hypothetical protein